MNAQRLIDSLDRFGKLLPAVISETKLEDARWRPADGSWSILEVVNHLADEEVDDFRARLERTLSDTKEPWPPVDPEAWAIERRYNEGDLGQSLSRFISSREETVRWLRSLDNPDWSRAYEHPKLGPIRAGDLLVSWAAHDMLHLRQIAKRMYQLAQRDGGRYEADYAGPWRA